MVNGKAYGLTMHLNRLAKSARDARITPPPLDELRSAVLGTIAASGLRDGVYARFWLSAGRGDFSVSPGRIPEHGALPDGAGRPSFYVMAHRSVPKDAFFTDPDDGIAEVTVGIGLKTQQLATMKSNNYMINALVAMEAEENGGTLGIQVDGDGMLLEQSIACVAIVTREGKLIAPPFDHTLASTTLIRAFDLAREELLGPGKRLTAVVQRNIHLEEALQGTEMLSLGGEGVTGWSTLRRLPSRAGSDPSDPRAPMQEVGLYR